MSTRHRIPARVALAATALLVPLVSSCGDDDRLSEAEFLEQGNAICAGGTAEIEAAAEEIAAPGQPPTEDQFREFTEVLVPTIRQQIEDLDELAPPSALEDDVDAMLGAARTELDQMVVDIDTDWEAFAQSEEDPFADTNARAIALGLNVCGQS